MFDTLFHSCTMSTEVENVDYVVVNGTRYRLRPGQSGEPYYMWEFGDLVQVEPLSPTNTVPEWVSPASLVSSPRMGSPPRLVSTGAVNVSLSPVVSGTASSLDPAPVVSPAVVGVSHMPLLSSKPVVPASVATVRPSSLVSPAPAAPMWSTASVPNRDHEAEATWKKANRIVCAYCDAVLVLVLCCCIMSFCCIILLQCTSCFGGGRLRGR